MLSGMAADKRKPSRKRERRPSGQPGPRPAPDPGPPYVVVWHPEAAANRDASWSAREKVAMLHAAQKLEGTGPCLGYPHSSAVRGELGQGFRELRPRGRA
jgi:hypothetical protein